MAKSREEIVKDGQTIAAKEPHGKKAKPVGDMGRDKRA